MKLEVRPPCIQVALTQQVFTRVEGETPWGHMAPSQGCWELGGAGGNLPWSLRALGRLPSAPRENTLLSELHRLDHHGRPRSCVPGPHGDGSVAVPRALRAPGRRPCRGAHVIPWPWGLRTAVASAVCWPLLPSLGRHLAAGEGAWPTAPDPPVRISCVSGHLALSPL